MKRAVIVLIILCAVGFAVFFVCLLGVCIDMLAPENAVKSDCIIVPGCKVTGTTPSLSLQSRLDCALRLYNDGFAKAIIVCGGQGVTGDVTEARAMRAYLVNNGVPEAAVLLEENSFSTGQNMVNSKAIMDEKGFTSAIVATSDFHAARAMALARIAGIARVSCGKARFSWPMKWFSVMREVPGWGKFLLAAIGVIEA
jgi:uncharacterized SAM-binding protein YcdF (DUF218 family)